MERIIKNREYCEAPSEEKTLLEVNSANADIRSYSIPKIRDNFS